MNHVRTHNNNHGETAATLYPRGFDSLAMCQFNIMEVRRSINNGACCRGRIFLKLSTYYMWYADIRFFTIFSFRHWQPLRFFRLV